MTTERLGTPALTLISHHLCPYVQRAAIMLAEKGVPFERRNIDLANKPNWFRAISPLGKVPLLLVQHDESEVAIFESAVICEYLEETQAGPQLHPADPLERAQHRGWIEFGSSILEDLWGLETATDADSFTSKQKVLVDKFGRLEEAMDAEPFFAGQRFSIVDVTYAPIFRWLDVLDAIADTGVLNRVPKVRAWRTALAARPSVASAVSADYADRLRASLAERDAYLLKISA